MSDLVETGGVRSLEPPTFSNLDAVWVEIAAVREAAAVAIEPSNNLLARMDAALNLAARHRRAIEIASAPVANGVLATYLGLLLKAYPNAGHQDARVFGKFLREDVMSLAPPIAAAEMACRRWRQKSKFLPAISEMMDEVRAAASQVTGAAEFIERLPALRERMAQRLAGG